MADDDHHVRRRRRDALERLEYGQALQQLVNFVGHELSGVPGGGGSPGQPRPDDGEWKIQRQKTIRKLNEFRQKLDSICVGANYGKAVGNGAEIVGAVTAIIGAVMSLLDIKSSDTVLKIGNLVQNSGTLIDGVSNVVENVVSAKYLSEIEAELLKDKALSRPLEEWLDYSRRLDANIEFLFGVSLESEKLNTVMKVFAEFSKFKSSTIGFDETMNLMKQGRYSVYIGNDVKLEKLQKLFQHLSTRPQLANKVQKAFSILATSTGRLQLAREGVQVYRSITGTSSSAIPSLQGGQSLEIPTAGAVASFSAFQAINMGVSVVSLINAKSIIANGKSRYSNALQTLTRALELELRQMENQ